MTGWLGSRRRLLQVAGGALFAGLAPRALGAHAGPLLSRVRVGNGSRPFARDTGLLTTVSPAGARRTARLDFHLARPAVVSFDVEKTGQGVSSERPVTSGETGLAHDRLTLEAGVHSIGWSPPPALPARTYVLRLTASSRRGAPAATASAHAVVRLLGVDASFTARSVRPGETAGLTIRTDARTLSLQVLRCGTEAEPTYANNELKGVAAGPARRIDWSGRGDAPAEVYVEIGSTWPSGIYAARLDSDDGRTGFAPLVVRPAAPAQRVAVVVPTSTWQAYNFYDEDGDGWGDTWYARWKTKTVDLSRPHANRGVPYRFRSYELSFYHWLAARGIAVDYYSDEDVEGFADPATLRAAYDLLVFSGHTEYVTPRLYDMVEGYRDAGGNLLFLSANNFFRRVDREGSSLHLVDEWRKLGRPEAGLCGVQYIASDRGERHAPFTVTGADVAPWAFAGTGLGNGSQFGLYGIEIDARGPASPPGTTVLATIPDLFGPGRSAEMTYYEHPSGARVFSAGALNFGGQILLWPQTAQLLDNIWARLA